MNRIYIELERMTEDGDRWRGFIEKEEHINDMVPIPQGRKKKDLIETDISLKVEDSWNAWELLFMHQYNEMAYT